MILARKVQLGWMHIYDLHKYHIALLAHRQIFFKEQAPYSLGNYEFVGKKYDRKTYPTRTAENKHLKLKRTFRTIVLGGQSLSNQIVKVWNPIELNTRELKYDGFKKKIRKKILDNPTSYRPFFRSYTKVELQDIQGAITRTQQERMKKEKLRIQKIKIFTPREKKLF